MYLWWVYSLKNDKSDLLSDVPFLYITLSLLLWLQTQTIFRKYEKIGPCPIYFRNTPSKLDRQYHVILL